MKLQASQFAPVFERLRDHAKPYTQQDAADLAAIRADMPPSKAHIKRIARHAAGTVHVDAKRVPTAKQMACRTLTDAQHAFHKRMIADLGGSRTIAATTEGELYNCRKSGMLTFIDPLSKTECCAPSETSKRKTLYLRTRVELAKMVYADCPSQTLFDYVEFGPAL